MPGCICPIHGNTYLSEVCRHIGQGIDSRTLPARIFIVVSDLGDLPGDTGDVPLLFKYFYCPVCAERHSLPDKDSVLPADEAEALPEIFTPVCADCFREALELNRIAVGDRLRALLSHRV